MVGSTTPFTEQADWHPVHRANAMLRAALLSSARQAEATGDLPSVESLSRAAESVLQGPVHITFPQPLAARLDALRIEEDDFPAFETLVGRTFSAETPGAEEEPPEPWDELEDANAETEEARTDARLDHGLRALPPQMHMQSLLHEFHRRQRQASVLVAGCIATAVLLTVGGFWLVANYAAPHGSDSALRSTSVAWQRPATNGAGTGLPPVSVSANREAKGEPLLVPRLAAFPKPSSPPTPVILATTGRQIAFAPFLPPSHAGNFLIRALPAGATLSAGQRSDSGTWLVNSEQAHAPALAVGDVAEGDYPIEVYVLRSGDSPQARRNLVLRIGRSLPTHAAPSNPGWASALLGLVPAARAAEAPAIPSQPAALRDRAKRLLDEGDIAGARLLLLYLAEQGEGEAAYELARTFDDEMLNADFGARGVQGELAQARDWYARAAQSGNAKATERLKVLASFSGTGPSD
jgi:hypothetical protein